ncbi:peptidylprolyl isomerase [Iningainema tapete]|uniref:peptidylprolyl isomerase n=1 Tax=Iningainema tapete BLCC-T55 TaxID=2748662 RepID=A0A8J7BYL5_9CYAN|nr:peptidylprolyl isomerase [Iningainema tapete]MBD2774258.1 peptidylprolyl isomerase [Iningainema tapete BLCC-T55]
MSAVLQIGNRVLAASEIIPLLASYNIIPQLLCESIIDSAIAPITCTPEETARLLEQFYQHWNLTSQEKRQDWRSRYGLTQEELELLATRKFRVEKFKEVTWGHQLKSYFLKRKRQLDKVIYSLIRTEERGTANELYFRIQEGEQSIAELAREYSSGLEAQTGGIIGPVEFGTIAPNFAQLLYTSQPGIVQPPVPFGEWWVIVRVEKLIPAQLDDFMHQRLLQENFEAWFQQQLSQLSAEEKIWMGVKSKPAQLEKTGAA